MTKEEKQILLQDLCAKSPFCLYVQGVSCATPFKVVDIDFERECVVVTHETNGIIDRFEDIKPYLRPMESMTESEYNEFQKAVSTDNGIHFGCVVHGKPKIFTLGVRALDWYNKIFDHRWSEDR